MHESRIAALEGRLVILHGKLAEGKIDVVAYNADCAATEAELAALRGIAGRNAAWAKEAPTVAAEDDKRAAKRRTLRERLQLTPGSHTSHEGV